MAQATRQTCTRTHGALRGYNHVRHVLAACTGMRAAARRASHTLARLAHAQALQGFAERADARTVAHAWALEGDV